MSAKETLRLTLNRDSFSLQADDQSSTWYLLNIRLGVTLDYRLELFLAFNFDSRSEGGSPKRPYQLEVERR